MGAGSRLHLALGRAGVAGHAPEQARQGRRERACAAGLARQGRCGRADAAGQAREGRRGRAGARGQAREDMHGRAGAWRVRMARQGAPAAPHGRRTCRATRQAHLPRHTAGRTCRAIRQAHLPRHTAGAPAAPCVCVCVMSVREAYGAAGRSLCGDGLGAAGHAQDQARQSAPCRTWQI
jgi:hypothetical protein